MAVVGLGIPSVRREPRHDELPPRPDDPRLVDRYGRVGRDLRISLTTACNLRCTYCMPAEGLPVIPRDELLTPEEIARLVGIGVRMGIRDVRFTGGEPLLRRDLEKILSLSRASADAALRDGAGSDVDPVSFAITTNALGLEKRAPGLVAAGLKRINVSLDTVDHAAFAALTRRDRLEDVLTGIRGAIAAGLAPVKINAVLLPQVLDGASDLLAWALEHGCRLRFIEEMPLDADGNWTRDDVVSAADLLERLGRRFTLTPAGREDPSAPAEEWLVEDTASSSARAPRGTVGIIASVTRSFCRTCDRTRLTAEGTVRSCLFGDEETDLRVLLRSGATDTQVADAWRGAMWAKPRAHGSDAPELASDAFADTTRSMGAIGG